MYKAFYGLQDKPFSQTPDLKYFYTGSCQKEALQFLSSAIKQDNAHHIVLTGGIGSGKTMLLRGFVKNLGKNYSVVQVCYPAAVGSQLLQMILQSAGIESNQEDSELLRKKLTDHLITMHKKRKRTVLVVDEAQNIGDDALKEACRLSELKTGKNCLAKIVFSGLPKMMKKINALHQVGLPDKLEIIHLNNLSVEEVSEYIRHRLVTAGHSDMSVYPEDMIMEIGRLSGGAPRNINMICDALLTHGFLAHEKIISQATLKEVINKLFYLDAANRIPPEQSLAPSDRQKTGKGIIKVSVTADVKKQENFLQAAAEISVHRKKAKTIQDKIPLPEHRLPLTILILEKNARMKVHLENEFRRHGCNFLVFQRLEELLQVLDRPMEVQLPIIVADASFFFNITGDEDPQGKGILDSIQARYAYIPVIMTSTLPLTAIRTKLFQRGIPFLMKKPDLTNIDMSQVRSQLDLFFNTLQNSIANIHYQLGQFYNMVIKWNPQNTEE
jgi:type II secretory pathway predicted ATPase ExeA